ncbi:MAG: hypothetical protein CML13_06890 [Puniceicoccaceae bacterium]|nr:hypothetical protein [Puniceicoccaceae bacterium]
MRPSMGTKNLSQCAHYDTTLILEKGSKMDNMTRIISSATLSQESYHVAVPTPVVKSMKQAKILSKPFLLIDWSAKSLCYVPVENWDKLREYVLKRRGKTEREFQDYFEDTRESTKFQLGKKTRVRIPPYRGERVQIYKGSGVLFAWNGLFLEVSSLDGQSESITNYFKQVPA